MDTEAIKNYYGQQAIVDNNILTDFLELTAALEDNYLQILNKLFQEVIIPTPILDDEIIGENLEELDYKEGIFREELGYKIFIELGEEYKSLSEYDRYVVAIAGELDSLVASNDGPVRQVCDKYEIEVAGSLGIICSAYENSLISFKAMEMGLKFLFSDQSSCYLGSGLQGMVFSHYSIKF